MPTPQKAPPDVDAGRRRIEYQPLDTIPRAVRNPKTHDLDRLTASITRHGFTTPVIVDERTGRLVAGHGRLDALAALTGQGQAPPDGVQVDDTGAWLVPVVRGWSSRSDIEAEAMIVADNRLTEVGGWDDRALAELLEDLLDTDPDLLDSTGFTTDDLDRMIAGFADDTDHDGAAGGDGTWDPDEGETKAEEAAADDPDAPRPSLADRFLAPPFDVLDARSGWWRARKTRWLQLGIRSEVGRTAVAFKTKQMLNDPRFGRGPMPGGGGGVWMVRGTDGTVVPEDPAYGGWVAAASNHGSGTSVFDPVICELAYRWFSPTDAQVLDPFSGGSVRGLMACLLGRRYTGNDLSTVQVDANEAQAREFVARGLLPADRTPTWTVGDSDKWVRTLEPESFDMILTCPPYADLEKYSDDPTDLSNMDSQGFAAAYGRILAGAAAALRPDRFAVIVVGQVRDRRTAVQRDLRSVTIDACAAAGLHLHNAAVLVTPAGSLPVRAGAQFSVSRMLGRTHQDVLVFLKGDRKAAATACGAVDVSIPGHLQEELDAADQALAGAAGAP